MNNNERIVFITSKLIYFSNKYNLLDDFLENISKRIECKILNEIFIETLKKYEIPDYCILIDILIKNNKFGKIYNFILENNFPKFENLLNQRIIDNNLFFENNNFNYLLLDNLYKEKFFEEYKSSYYAIETIKRLEILGNNIIEIKNISYNQMISLNNKKDQLDIFSLVGKEKLFKNKIIDSLNDNIIRLDEIIRNIKGILNDFQNLEFSSKDKLIEWINIIINELKEKKFPSITDFKNGVYKIKYIHKLFINLKEKKIYSNSFFNILEGKQKVFEGIIFSLFENFLYIFDKDTSDKIISSLLSSIFSINKEERNKIILNLFEINYLYRILFLNDELIKIPKISIEISKEINDIINNIILFYLRDKIYKDYKKVKKKLKNKNPKKNKKTNKNNKNFTIQELISFLSFVNITKEMIYENEKIMNEIEKNKFFIIINLLSRKKEALDFLLSITSQDCRNLQELAGEVHGGNNQNFLSIEELLTLEKIVEIFENIRKEIKSLTNEYEDHVIILNLVNQIEEEDLIKYLDKYPQYKEFCSENLDKNKFITQVIQKILNKSTFIITNSCNLNFQAYYYHGEKEIKYKNLNYDYMIYLRDRALTRYKISDSVLNNEDKKSQIDFKKTLKEEEEIIFKNNKIFIECVHQINEILKILNKLSKKGFLFYFENEKKNNNNENEDIISFFDEIEKINAPLFLKIKIKIEKENNLENDSYKIQFFLNQEEIKDFNTIYEMIKNIYDNIMIIQKNGYLKKKYINFIYGKQFYLFFDYFYNKKINDNFIYYLCYFANKEKIDITNNYDYQNQNLNPKEDLNLKFYQNFIEHCEIFLDDILKKNSLSLESIYQQNKFKEEYKKYKGIYLNGCTNLENEIILWYKYFTNNIPLACTLLLCNQDTSSEEIISFLYRAILCKYHICFCLARTEYLSEDKKNIILDTITELFSEIIEENKEMNSCLLIMNNNLEDELCKSLFHLKFINCLDIPQEKINKSKIFEEDEKEKILVIDSDHSGVGKSTYIKNQIKKKEDYIYFPLGGIFTKENTLKRLQDLNKNKNLNEKQNLLLHIDLYDTDQKSLMNDFLYFILVTKLYGQDNNIFYLSKKIKIYLEIPNSFINFFDKYPILRLFPEKKFYLDKLEPLLVPDDICSNIKIVSLYLHLLKEENILPENTIEYFKADNKIDKNEIVFPFTPSDLILKDEKGYDYNKIVIKAVDENKNLTQQRCQNLIMEEIRKTIKKPTYYQITTFINVLANQLIQFNRNFFLSACTILDTGKFDNCSIRSLIIRKFIELTRYFTKGAFTELLNEQEGIQTLRNSNCNEKEKIEKANNILENCEHESISFEKMDLALVFFHGGDNSNFFSIITNKNENDQTYIDLLNLKNVQSGKDIIKKIKFKDKKKIKLDNIEHLNDYRNYSQQQFLEELKSILDLKNPIENTNNNKEKTISLLEITKDYVFTADNFIKMCLILIRLRADIPVIMMGETGCGKTSLIRKLSELQNNGKCLLVIDNIHAGHTNEDIINFIEEKVIPEAKKLAELEKEKKEKYKKNNFIYEEKKLWVFFDELNTCKSMDLLSEIICKHSCQGKILPDNIIFIGAVNPYRKAKQKRVGLKINKNDNIEESDLVYTVNPMPHSLLNYVFDFGSLNSKDERKYINNIVKQTIFEEKLSNLATELIATAQDFIRKENGISSVSLREIRRFTIFYNFFLNYLKVRKEILIEEKIEEKEAFKYSKLSDFELKLYSINLSIYLGYYLRLTDTDNIIEGGSRKNLFEKLNVIFEKESNINFLVVPEKEENFIADNVELEKGIAKNRALLENLFSLFVAINTKIPIFILGKPGCSKSLSVQLINNAMKGSSSNNLFFKKYPKMYVSTYQGSLNSTSEGVKSIFEKAREILKVKNNKDIISTIYFDEMGLAEYSPHNPLKVIHSELEYDLNEDDKKVSFIGVSNWILDASKMNRGITITIPDPNEKDINTTSITIAKSYLGENLQQNLQSFFQKLSSCFYKYKQEFKKNTIIKQYEDFHGNRDFYHLIKYPVTKIKDSLENNNQIIDEKFLADLSIKGLGRNFGGLNINENKYSNGINLITEKFSEYNNEVKNIIKENNNVINKVKDKIIDNLIEPTDNYLSRYLLLITRSNIGIYLLSSFLKSINGYKNNFNNYTIIIGSIFLEDIEKEEYTTKILSKIKMNLEKDSILVLKDLESIYPSLYDLFNQNFVKVRAKKYARIALGSQTNSFSEVNNNFRCIVIVDEDKIQDQEIPFLNRFEKQNLSFEYLMNEEQVKISIELYKKFQSIINYNENELKLINYNINNLLINCGEEEILGIVYMETQGKEEINDNDYEIIENNLVSKISITLPQDIILILLMNKSNFEEKNENFKFYNKILDNYNKNIHNNIKSFLSNYENESNKIIIYTFTRIFDSIKQEYLYSYNIKSLGNINKNNIKQIKISSIQNEFNLESEIEEFLENKDLKIFIIKLLPYEYSTIDYLKNIIENKETEYKNNKKEKITKLFLFLVHLERISRKDLENPYKENLDFIKNKLLINTLSNLAGFYQVFIDDINGQDYFDNDGNIITLNKMLKMKDNELYKSLLNNKKTILLENLNSSLCFFDYEFNLDKKKLNKDVYINDLIELFSKDEHLIRIIDDLIMENINSKYNDNNKTQNLFEKIIKEEKFSKGDVCIFDIVKKTLNKNYINEFKILYAELENNYYFSSLLNNKKKYINNNITEDEEFQNNIKEIFIQNINIKNKIPENEMKFDIIIGYSLPSKNILEEIMTYINNGITIQYRQTEEDFKNKFFEEEEYEEGKNQYENNIQLLNKDTKENIAKNKLIKEIEIKFQKGKKNIFYNLLIEDYLFYFIDSNFKGQKLISINYIKSFMKIILCNKFDFKESNSDIYDVSTMLNWIQSYSYEIVCLIKLYSSLNSFIQNNDENNNKLDEKIKKNITESNYEYENLDINKNIKIINRVFYNIIGSLIKTLIIDLNNILSNIKNQEQFNNLLDNLNNLYYSLLSINNNLNLSCKEIYLLHETINVISLLSYNDEKEDLIKNRALMIDFIQKKIINKEKIEPKSKNEGPKLKNENNNEEEEEEDTEEEKYLKDKLKNFYNYYKEKNNINFIDSFSSVLFDEFNKEFNEKYRKYILKTILDDDNLIQYNILLIKIILAEYIKPEKEIFYEALDYISGEETYFPVLNNYKKEIVEKNIMTIFDSIINLFFDSLENLSEYIISDLFDIFKEYLRVIEEKSYEKYYDNYCNENLVKLYALCFIKIYLNRFIFFLCDNRNSLKGEENKIIEKLSGDSSLSNSMKIYFIILLYNKKNSLELLKDIKFNTIENFSNNLKNKFGENDYNNILNKSLIPKEDKYLFYNYFTYIKYPSFENFKSKFLSTNDNKEKYPLLNIYIKNESGPRNLKYLSDYNDFLNSMINYYSGKISRNEANKEERSLNLEEIFKTDENLRNKFDKFKSIWNDHLSDYLKDNENIIKNDKFLEKFEGNERLAYFLNDDDDKGYGIFIGKGLHKFIEWQNSFLTPIINSYKSRKNNILNCYISQIEKLVNVQDANNLQILQIEKCFENTYFINFNELLSIYIIRNNEDINDLDYNFGKIEEELGKSLLPNKCLFNEKNIKYVCYQNEGFRHIKYDFFIILGKKYGEKELSEEDKKKIYIYSNREYNNFDILYDSFILLVNYLNNYYYEKRDTKIIDFINKAKKKYFNFCEQFINFFNEEGKDIIIEKLLNSILYMEHLCYEHLIDKIDNKFKSTLDKSQKEEINKYFEFNHKDEIITKKEISSAVRRFIIRYLLNDNKKENIDPNLKLYNCLQRKYLWKNKIFSSVGDNFNNLIKQYIGNFSFSLEVRHSLNFYNLIGDEEKKFIMEEKDNFAGKAPKIEIKIKTQEPPKLGTKVIGMGGKKIIIKGKMKPKK